MQSQTTDQEKHFQGTGKTKAQYLQFTQSFQSSAAERQLDKMDRKRDKTTEGGKSAWGKTGVKPHLSAHIPEKDHTTTVMSDHEAATQAPLRECEAQRPFGELPGNIFTNYISWLGMELSLQSVCLA